ncbi:MAG: transporter [Burkholderiales bacterium]|jgi:hypothetical protein|nr:MAG: transporter [Burkholderiales bacterium]
MRTYVVRLLHRLLLGCASGSILAWAAPALAQQAAKAPVEDANAATLDRLEQSVHDQAARIEAQQKELQRQTLALAEQRAELSRQIADIQVLRGNHTNTQIAMGTAPAARVIITPSQESDAIRLSNADMVQLAEAPIGRDAFATLRAGQSPSAQPAAAPAAQPQQTVGAQPPESGEPAPQMAALPESIGVLTPPGTIIFDPSLEYSNTSGNRLVFRGVEIVTGVQIGVIEASDTDRDSVTATLAARMGITNRLEIEARVPYLYRHDEITTLAQRDETITRTTSLEGANIGDIELAARYQMTDGHNGWPIMVGNLRYKSNTGKGPFDIARDEFGIATKLPTGSGFWGVEPSLTLLMPSDPAVLFATLGYLYHAPDTIDKEINGVTIGEVDPGDSINASLGFGFAVNPNFSFSLGYRHSYIKPTRTQLNGLWQESDDLQAGSIQMGLSYRFNERNTVNTSFEFGITEDAPDARIVFRMPFSN